MNEMTYFSHRGNLDGINKDRENAPDYIDEAIEQHFQVEVDLRLLGSDLYLGHDYPQYKISPEYIYERSNALLLHIKDMNVLKWIVDCDFDWHYFCHQSDPFTITSKGYIWQHDLNSIVGERSIVPLLSTDQYVSYEQFNYYGICSDYVKTIKEII